MSLTDRDVDEIVKKIRKNQYSLEDCLPKENTDKQTSYAVNSYQIPMDEEDKARNKSKCLKYLKICILFILMLLVIFGLLGYTFYQSKQYGDLARSFALRDTPTSNNVNIYANGTAAVLRDTPNSNNVNIYANGTAARLLGAAAIGEQTQLNIGMRQDYLLQECQGTQLKHSFPDLDYSLLGYNILQGYPLAVGHDPGFTLPIIVADYSAGGMTADCRYSVPRGLLIIPDVSCVTSFESSTIQSQSQLSESLSVSASVSAGFWGVSFSASAGYKASSSELSTGEYVYILSTASCNYYFSKLMTESIPKFHSNFLAWVYILNKTNSSETYFDFFNTYGTHFPNYVTYGARFTYEHRMDSSKYETETKSGVNVEVQASYSGLFSVSGGFNMDSSQQQSASSFSKSVTTKTITVGAAPPSNGDANTWASEVKTSPVPTSYKLDSIELLFTHKYMGYLNVRHEQIAKNIEIFQKQYCSHLKVQGKLDTCKILSPGIKLKNTMIYKYDVYATYASSIACLEHCQEDLDCIGVSYCTKKCWNNDCFIFKENGTDKTAYLNWYYKRYLSRFDKEETWNSNIFPAKIKTQLKLVDTAVNGGDREHQDEDDGQADQSRCHQVCSDDVYCIVYSYWKSTNQTSCKLYSEAGISGLEKKTGTTTVFLPSRNAKITTQTSPFTTTSPSTTTSAPDTLPTTSITASPAGTVELELISAASAVVTTGTIGDPMTVRAVLTRPVADLTGSSPQTAHIYNLEVSNNAGFLTDSPNVAVPITDLNGCKDPNSPFLLASSFVNIIAPADFAAQITAATPTTTSETGTFALAVFSSTRDLYFRASYRLCNGVEQLCTDQEQDCIDNHSAKKRRRRSAEQGNLTQVLRVEVSMAGKGATLSLGGDGSGTNDEYVRECQEATKFWIAAIVMGILLLIVLVFAVFLFYKLQNQRRHNHKAESTYGVQNPSF